jgi:hypothetical protein
MTMKTTELLATAEPAMHMVQFYGADERLLVRNIARYIWDGYDRGSGALAVLGRDHKLASLKELQHAGVGEDDLRRANVSFLDAYETLSRIRVDGRPDPGLFDTIVGRAVRELSARSRDGKPRVYGEMVGIAWRAGQYATAVRLEQLWNRLLKTTPFSLFCAYPVSVFDEHFKRGSMDGPLCAHTHVVPMGYEGSLETALYRAADEVLGVKAAGLREVIAAERRSDIARMSLGEATILWLRENLSDKADDILSRARRYFDQAA